MTALLALALCLAGFAPVSPGGHPDSPPTGPTVRYTISFENAAHHEAEVTARFTGVAAETLEVRMSRSSPGRYALTEFRRQWLGPKNPAPGPPLVKYCAGCSREHPFDYRFCPYDGDELKLTKE